MAYEKIGWKDYPDKTTPMNAKNFSHMDEGIFENSVAIGETSKIAEIGDGTVTGAIAAQNETLEQLNEESTSQNVTFTNRIDELNTNLTADGTPFRFGKDASGSFGYIITDEAGADTVIPFKTTSASNAYIYTLTQRTTAYAQTFIPEFKSPRDGYLYFFITGTCGYGDSYMGNVQPVINGTKYTTARMASTTSGTTSGAWYRSAVPVSKDDKISVYGTTNGYTVAITWTCWLFITD